LRTLIARGVLFEIAPVYPGGGDHRFLTFQHA
jgi:hypothetical protein